MFVKYVCELVSWEGFRCRDDGIERLCFDYTIIDSNPPIYVLRTVFLCQKLSGYHPTEIGHRQNPRERRMQTVEPPEGF